MSVDVTVRHMKTRPAVQEYGRSLGEMLIEEFPRLESVHVVLDVGKRDQHIAAVIVQGKGHIRFESMEAAASMRVAIDGAFTKAEAHLRKILTRARDKKVTRGREGAAKARLNEEG